MQKINPFPREAVEGLSRGLKQIWDWMRAKKLKLNPDKTRGVVGRVKPESGEQLFFDDG